MAPLEGVLKDGRGPHSNLAVLAVEDCWYVAGGFFKGTDRCFCLPDPPLRREGSSSPTLNSSSGKLHSRDGVVGVFRNSADLCGVSNATGAAVTAAVTFLRGSCRIANRARLSFSADRSAFKAAAVVTATWGVTLNGRLETGSGSRASRLLSKRNDDENFSLETRDVNCAISSCC